MAELRGQSSPSSGLIPADATLPISPALPRLERPSDMLCVLHCETAISRKEIRDLTKVGL